jgi:RNA ligase
MKLNLEELEKRIPLGLIKKSVHPTGKYTVWCYTDKCQYDKIWDEYTMVARGIVTLPDGEVISKPFSKFFNLGEKEAEPIYWGEEIEVTTKLDGSLIVVSFFEGEMVINSKCSFTSEHARFASSWLHWNAPDWINNCKRASRDGYGKCITYCFEAIFDDKDNPKVINYGDKRDLNLLYVYIPDYGELPYPLLVQYGLLFNLPVVERHNFNDINEIIVKCKSQKIQDGEGLVLHFIPSHRRIKVKSDEYIRLHRLISGFNPKNILESIIAGDDINTLYANLPDELYADLVKWTDDFNNQYKEIESWIYKSMPDIRALPTKKEQALYINGNPGLKEYSGALFALIDGKSNLEKQIWGIIKKRNSSKTV